VHTVRPGSLADRLFSLPVFFRASSLVVLTPPSPPNGNAVQGQLGLSYDIGSINVPQGQKVGATQTFDGIPDVTFANGGLSQHDQLATSITNVWITIAETINLLIAATMSP